MWKSAGILQFHIFCTWNRMTMRFNILLFTVLFFQLWCSVWTFVTSYFCHCKNCNAFVRVLSDIIKCFKVKMICPHRLMWPTCGTLHNNSYFSYLSVIRNTCWFWRPLWTTALWAPLPPWIKICQPVISFWKWVKIRLSVFPKLGF